MPWLSTLSHKVLLAITYDDAAIVVIHFLTIQVVCQRIVAMCNLNVFYRIGIRDVLPNTHGDVIDVSHGGCVNSLNKDLQLVPLGNNCVVVEGDSRILVNNLSVFTVTAGYDSP